MPSKAGSKINAHALFTNIDGHMPGRVAVTQAEAEALLAVRDFELGSWDADDIIQAAQLPQHIVRPGNPGQ